MDGENSILGWRLVRPLSDESGRCRYVAVAELDGQEAGSAHWHGFAHTASPAQTQRGIVVVAAGEQADGLIRECEVREQIDSEFVARAWECGRIASERTAAVFPLEPTTGLGRILTGPELASGVAVTLLVPIIEAVQRAHSHGHAHGSLGISVCEVDEHGRPRVEGWHTSKTLAGLSAARADLARAEDLRALARIAHAVLARVRAAAPDSVTDLLERMEARRAPKAAAEALMDELFDWAPPAPLGQAATQQLRSIPSAGLAEWNADTPSDAATGGAGSDDDPLLEVAPLTPGLTLRRRWVTQPGAGRRAGAGSPSRGLRAALVGACAALGGWSARIRARMWLVVAAVGAVISLAGGLILIAPGVTTAARPSDDAAAPRPSPALLQHGDDDGYGAAPAGTTPEVGPVDLEALLAERDRCRLAGDPVCLGQVYAPSAPGLEIELAQLAAPDAPASAGCGPWQLTADLGDVQAYAATACPHLVSVSVQRGDGGWRLRELRWSA